MENIEIKNRNIFLNLNEGEEIVYVAEKIKSNFYWNFFTSVIIGIPLFGAFAGFGIFALTLGDANMKFILSVLFILLMFIMFCFISYKVIVDYFYTELILTNQRFIVSKFHKISFINFEQIKRITGTYGVRGGPIQLTIKFKNKKLCSFYFIDKNIIRAKFKEVYPNYDDSEAVAKEQKLGYIILFVLILLFPFLLYSNYKLRMNSYKANSHKAAKHQHYTKEPYFDLYMTNLQNKIKGNWNPPAGKESSNVILLFKVDRGGNILKAKILKSSNNMAIDTSALQALKKSEPLAPLPKEFKGKDIDVQFTFDYNVLSHKPRF